MSRARTSGLIVPVDAARPLIAEWLGLLPPASRELPSHVTVLWPFLAPEALDARVERDLAALFASAAPFDFALTRVGGFPDVVFLVPEPSAPFGDLTRLVWQRWPECPPLGGAYDEIVPHLTVATDPTPAQREAIRASMAGRLPVAATAEAVLLVVEDDEGVLRERRRFTLGGSSSGTTRS